MNKNIYKCLPPSFTFHKDLERFSLSKIIEDGYRVELTFTYFESQKQVQMQKTLFVFEGKGEVTSTMHPTNTSGFKAWSKLKNDECPDLTTLDFSLF